MKCLTFSAWLHISFIQKIPLFFLFIPFISHPPLFCLCACFLSVYFSTIFLVMSSHLNLVWFSYSWLLFAFLWIYLLWLDFSDLNLTYLTCIDLIYLPPRDLICLEVSCHDFSCLDSPFLTELSLPCPGLTYVAWTYINLPCPGLNFLALIKLS